MKNNKLLYPITFHPILKEKIWGGKKLSQLFNKPRKSDKIGESWELSAVNGNVSVVANGMLKGKTLTQLISLYDNKLLGKHVYEIYGHNFPLLFKFIDASQDLSVQLHPNDEIANKRHNSFGKTEMWYILQAEKESKLVLGFNTNIDKEQYKKYLLNGEIESILHYKKVKKGDSFFIAPGTVHAIGKGIVLAEIQQTSDITYRIYDWNRVGLDGKPRELHTQWALDSINFSGIHPKIDYTDVPNTIINLSSNEYFICNKLLLSKTINRNTEHLDSFVVYMCIEGKATITVGDFSQEIFAGETVLIPAITTELSIETSQAIFLEIYIP